MKYPLPFLVFLKATAAQRQPRRLLSAAPPNRRGLSEKCSTWNISQERKFYASF